MPRSKLFRPRDELDGLLAEALAHQLNHCRGKGSVNRLKAIDLEIHNTYANPENWDQTGLVVITYIDERTGEQTNLGIFQETIHRRTQARKLSRVELNDTAIAFTPTETPVKHWLTHDEVLLYGPPVYCTPSPPQSVYERQAIRDYLARQPKEISLMEFFGKPDADRLLKQLREME